MSGQGTGRIVGAIAGAALAYFTGGTSVLAGAALGSAVGGMFDKTKTEGPRLDNLSVQQSNYGVGIPTLYGTERITPNVMWSTDKLPFTSSQGKGGGVENTNWRSFVHMRHILCETPRDGSTVQLVKIIQDGKLIWDASSGIPVGSALASAENLFASFILYQGHQDQMPNPEEETWLGVGNVPAYRGVVSIYMRAIECPGGRVPQFSFVLSNSYSGTAEILPISTVTLGTQLYGGTCNSEGAYHYQYDSTTGVGRLTGYLVGSGYTTRIWQITYPANSTNYSIVPVAGAKNMALRARNPQSGADSATMFLDTVDLRTGIVTALTQFPKTVFASLDRSAGVAFDPVYGSYAFNQGYSSSTIFVVGSSGSTSFAGPSGYCGAFGFYNNLLYVLSCTGFVSGTMTFYTIDPATGNVLSSIAGPTPATDWSAQSVAIQADANGVYLYLNPYSGVALGCVYKLSAAGSWTLLCASVKRFDFFGNTVSPHFYTDGQCAVTGPHLDGTYDLTRFASYDPIPVKAKDIIADQCQRAGNLTYDVSALPDSDAVIGYELKGPSSARTNIDPLLTCFGIYAVDEDGLTKFKKLSAITSVATVTFDELGQTEGDAVDAMPLARTQEIDLPRSVTVNYVEAGLDYQTASETEVRQVTEATEDVSIDLPIAVTSDQAKTAAWQILFARWRSQNTRTCSVSRKFAFVSPGDGVTVEYPRGTLRMWRAMSVNDTRAVIEWTLEPADSNLFTHTAIGATGYDPQQVAPLPAPTRALILDMPCVRDGDSSSAGPYVALDSYGTVPATAELFVGDSDVNLATRGTVSASAPIGFAESVLGDWQRGLVDETNVVTVNLGDDTISSVTRDVLLAGGAEYWAYGAPGRWEIGSSAQADSLGSGRFILSRHLRGLFGTERNAALHQAGDTFVLLRQVGMLMPDTGVGGIGQPKSYRAITKGRSLDSASSQTYANTGESLMPLSPVNLRRSDTNDFTVDRRSRVSMNFATGVLPLGEATEAYSWAFYSSSAYTTLLATVVTNTSTITAAQMTAAGLTPAATAFLRVRQISDRAGAGHELQATA